MLKLSGQGGFSLIEVLIAWVILSVVLLGVFKFQTLGLFRARHAYLLGLAVTEVTSFLEQLHVNKSDSARVRAYRSWQARLQETLPHSKGDYSCQVFRCTISVQWQERVMRSISLTTLIA